jgi:serine/threonine-protein kinase HipA
MNFMKKINIYSNKDTCGVLAKEDDNHVFSYDSHAKNIVSITMPLRTQSWISRELHPIFQMNLPEGALKERIQEQFSKIMTMDDLSILQLIGPYVIGRIKYGLPQEQEESISLNDILENDTNTLFETLMKKYAIRSGISGVQPKMLLDIQNKSTLISEHYIVKSWGEEYPELALNEFFCMKALQYANLQVPEFHLSNNRSMFIMKRFDIQNDGTFLGFEDGCVLLGKYAHQKYEASYEDLAKAIKASVRPEDKKRSLKSLFTTLILSHILGNGDAHLKNFGILYQHDYTDAMLAPIYDVVCTTVYIKEDIPALKMSGGKLWWKEKTYRNFAKNTCQLKTAEIDSIFQLSCNAVRQTIDDLNIYTQEHPNVSPFAQQLITIWKKGIDTFIL